MDIFKKNAMESHLEVLLAKPEWKDYLMDLLVDQMDNSNKINDLPNTVYNLPDKVLIADAYSYQEIILFFKPEQFYDLLKKHIKPTESENKPIFDSKMLTFQEGKFSEKDVIWNTKEKGKQKASEIPTKYLFFCIRMCYNTQVKSELRIDFGPPKNEQKNLWQASPAIKHTLKCMFYQIGLRDDLTEEQFEKLTLMAKNVRLYL